MHFYLTGGTALAGFYLGHRYSDDLDFFTETEDFPRLKIEEFVEMARIEIGAEEVAYRKIYDRRAFFLKKKEEELKVEFVYYPFKRLERTEQEGIMVDSLDDIAANKLRTIFERMETKDFVDLYFLMKEKGFTLDMLQEKVKQKFHLALGPLALGSEFSKAEKIDKLPKMIKPLTIEELKAFFTKEAKKLEQNIFSQE